jgi:uncharacterized membrane protein YvlD (DUF360 family)
MSIRSNLPGYRWFHVFRNAAIRMGVYAGVCLTLVFAAWLVIANRVAFLERFALERNIAAAGVFAFLAAIPVLRFLRMPGNLLASSLMSWIIFSVSYRILCVIFQGLSDWHSTFQVFMLGAVVYMILTTLSWIGTLIWKARAAHATHAKRHAS